MACVEESELVRPQDNITETHVKAALTADKGSEAKLISWSIEDFTNKGDNYATIVTSVSVQFSLLGKEQSSSYVVKLNPKRPTNKEFSVFSLLLFKKEVEFFEEILPLLNYELTAVGLSPLRLAKWFYTSLEKGKEMIFVEDLRSRGFKLFDRKKSMGVAHATLILQELAKLHAASFLLQARFPTQDLADRFKHIKFDWLISPESPKKMFYDMFSGQFSAAEQMLHNIEGYAVAEQWLAKHKNNFFDLIDNQLARNSKFDAICHGDCWNNNVLFRNNAEGDPIEVMLLDLQLNRIASPATDLNYFLYTSLHGHKRKANLQGFLSSYYEAFQEVMTAAEKDIPFSPEELCQEYKDKIIFGILSSVMLVTVMLSESDDAIDIINAKEDDMQNLGQQLHDNMLIKLENNPLFRSRFLAIFDELVEREAPVSKKLFSEELK
ncbi:uncharacterized protein [Cherax quadricarinatus]|uniref:uncharacterized protein n=1 Tax=Cherax quadricarinatus TaxID=27406 RepID=UPI00387E62F6